jgi:hypothetical protein
MWVTLKIGGHELRVSPRLHSEYARYKAVYGGLLSNKGQRDLAWYKFNSIWADLTRDDPMNAEMQSSEMAH